METKAVLIPFGILIIISCAIGFAFQAVLGGFWNAFLAGILGQLLVYNIYKTFSDTKEKETGIRETLDSLVSSQVCPIACPCGKNVVEEPLFINGDNNFVCEVCKCKFRVEITYESVLQTEQVNLNTIFDVLKQKEQ
jgi:hypothetical protein